MSKKRPTILIADDEAAFRNAFVNAHTRFGFSIEEMPDVYSLPEKLSKMRPLPDLIVLDLYRTKSLGTSDEDADNAEVDRLLAKLDEDVKELKVVVDRVKDPVSISILHQIREIPRLKKLPVLLYTRQGLSLLSDEQLRGAIKDGAEWMLKGRSDIVEEAQINEFLRRARLKRRRLERDVALTILGAVLALILDTTARMLF